MVRFKVITIVNCPQSVPIKEFSKSVNNWHRYGQKQSAIFYRPRCIDFARSGRNWVYTRFMRFSCIEFVVLFLLSFRSPITTVIYMLLIQRNCRIFSLVLVKAFRGVSFFHS